MVPPRHTPGSVRRASADVLAALVGAVCMLLMILALRPAALAQDAADGNRTGSRGSADRFEDRFIGDERVSWLFGNVFIDRDTVTAEADTGVVYRDRDVFELYGHVRLTSHEAVVTCRRAIYDRSTGSGDFYGDVRIVEGDVVGTGRRGESRRAGRDLSLIGDALLVNPEYTVRADTIYRDRLTGFGEAFGNVQIIEPGARNLVTGDHAVFHTEQDVVEVDRNPVMTSREQTGGPLVSTGGRMLFHRAENRVVMIDSVHIRQGSVRARGDTAVAYGRDRLVLTGSPEVNRGGNSVMTGDEIEFRYAGGQLRRVILVGNARMEDTAPDSLAAIYGGLPGMDVLAGDSISIEFEDEEIRRSVVVGAATSRYTPLDITDEVATNDVAGDTIIIYFRDERAQRVDVRGNMSGTYRFARITEMEDILGRSRRLADLLARTGADSAAVAAGDTAALLAGDAQRLAAVDSVAREIGLALPGVGAAAGAGRPTLIDSLLTAALDSLATAGLDTSRSDLDFESAAQQVLYSGDSAVFAMRDRKIDIAGNGSLEYGTMTLTAQHIKLDTDERELYAEGEPLVVDNETIAGDRMGYNFQHKTGAVDGGVTSMDRYYYIGDEIRRFEDSTMKIYSGRMTSCDLEDPHYYFWSGKMKMRANDKVVAAPVVMRVGRVPVFALPFYYKTLKTGRQSGILFPSFDFGWSSREGRYIRDFGYYWATNDYMDFIMEGDYNERQDLGWRISNRYRKRYAFNGGIDYSRKIGLGETSVLSDWQLRWNHTQPTLMDDYSFRAEVRLASTTLSSNDLAGSNDRDVVSGQLKSNVSVARTWSWGNANVNASRDEFPNAEAGNKQYTMTAPSLSLGFRQFSLLPERHGSGPGSFLGNLGRATTFSHNYSLRSSEQGFEIRTDRQYQAQGSWALAVRAPRLAIFDISANTNASQRWERTESAGQVWDPADSNFVPVDEFFEETTPSWSVGASLGSTLYGLFPINLGVVRTVRHTLRLRTGWTLRPGLSGHQAHSTSYSFNLGNAFDVKYLSQGADSTLTEKKLDGLLDWDLSTSYNPKAEPERRWSDIRSTLQVKPGQSRYLHLRVNNTIDPKNLALKTTGFTYGLNFSGKMDLGEVPAAPESTRNAAIDRLGLVEEAPVDSTGYADDPFLAAEQDALFNGEENAFDDFYERQGRTQGPRDTKDPTEGGRYIPFEFGTNLSYNYTNRTATSAAVKRASAGINFKVNVTQKWEMRYTANFDLVESLPLRQQYSLNRDLHCWRLEFTRTISTVDSSFGFRFYLRTIPDLKLTRGREDYMSAPGGGFY